MGNQRSANGPRRDQQQGRGLARLSELSPQPGPAADEHLGRKVLPKHGIPPRPQAEDASHRLTNSMRQDLLRQDMFGGYGNNSFLYSPFSTKEVPAVGQMADPGYAAALHARLQPESLPEKELRDLQHERFHYLSARSFVPAS